MPAEQSNEKVKGWEIPICTGCGGVIGLRGLDAGCSCPVDFAKTGKHVEVVPAKNAAKLRGALAWALDWIECQGKPDGFDPAAEPEDWNEHFDAKAALSDFAQEADRG